MQTHAGGIMLSTLCVFEGGQQACIWPCVADAQHPLAALAAAHCTMLVNLCPAGHIRQLHVCLCPPPAAALTPASAPTPAPCVLPLPASVLLLPARGFKLLSAMGYQQGQGIGKSGTGLAEPLPLLLKQVGGGGGAAKQPPACVSLCS